LPLEAIIKNRTTHIAQSPRSKRSERKPLSHLTPFAPLIAQSPLAPLLSSKHVNRKPSGTPSEQAPQLLIITNHLTKLISYNCNLKPKQDP